MYVRGAVLQGPGSWSPQEGPRCTEGARGRLAPRCWNSPFQVLRPCPLGAPSPWDPATGDPTPLRSSNRGSSPMNSGRGVRGSLVAEVGKPTGCPGAMPAPASPSPSRLGSPLAAGPWPAPPGGQPGPAPRVGGLNEPVYKLRTEASAPSPSPALGGFISKHRTPHGPAGSWLRALFFNVISSHVFPRRKLSPLRGLSRCPSSVFWVPPSLGRGG